MPIKGPKGATPTTRGWVSAKGELLKSQKISEDQIAEWNDEMNPKPQVLRESPVTEEEVIEEHMEDPLEHNHFDWWHEVGTTHSHEGGDETHHHHEDGTTHDHEGGDKAHNHDEPKKGMLGKLFS